MRVLIVEDEQGVAEFLEQALRESDYEVVTCLDGKQGLGALLGQPFDVALLDIMLPGLSGLDILKTAREKEIATAVLMLTARGETHQKVQALDAGADDYLVKPFKVDELLARVRALSRRIRAPVQTVGDLTVDSGRRTVERDGKHLFLSPTEFSIIELLLSKRGDPVSKPAILNHVWPGDPFRDPNTVEVYINFLRNKLEGAGGSRLIHTVRGKGYSLKDPSTQ